MKKFFSKAFNINEGEHGRVLLSMLIFLIVMSGIMFGRNARDSIFLKNVGIGLLPYMYLLNAVFVVVVSIVYSSLIDKLDRTKFMIISFALYAGMAVLMKILLALPGDNTLKICSALCYVLVQIMWLIGLMQFWTFMGDVFDARESKRLFPVVSSGGLLGMVIAGLGGKPLINLIGGTENLFLVWAAMLGVGIVLIIVLHAKYIKKPEAAPGKPKAAAKPAPKKSQVEEFKEGFSYLKSSQLLKTMVFINLCMWIVFTIVDYTFNWQVNAQYGTNKDAMTAFLGMFRAGAGFLCLIIQLGVTTRLVSYFGVGRTINVHPAYMVAATAFLATKFNFISAFTSKFGDHVLLYTVQDSSYQMLYNPVPPDKRGRARAFVEGYIKPISMGIAGIVLIVSVLLLDAKSASTCTVMAAISFLAALGWIFFSLRANKGYVKALTDGLTTTDLNFRASALTQLSKLSDVDNLKVLRGVLKSNDRDMTLFALEMIESLGAKEAVDDVKALLGSTDHHIRAGAICTLSVLCDSSILKDITSHLNDPKAEVREAAVRAFGRLGDEESLELISPLLSDKKKSVRTEAVVALIRAGGLDGILTAGDLLKSLLASGDPEEREQAADILGMVKVRHFTPTLQRLLDDPEPAVRIKALKALSKIEDVRAVGPLIHALADKHLARFAKKGLEKLQKKALPLLREAALSPDENIEVRQRCARLIGKIRDREAMAAVVEILKDKEPHVRGAALRSLEAAHLDEASRLGLKGPVEEYIRNEITYVCSMKMAGAYFATLGDKKPPDVLTDAIGEAATEGMSRVFNGLALILDRAAVRGIWSKLKSDDPKVKPLALEALDNIGGKELTRRITPMFEERSLADTVAWCRTAAGLEAPTEASMYARFAGDSSAWMRGCAAYAIGASRNREMKPVLDKLAADADSFVKETADWAVKNIAS